MLEQLNSEGKGVEHGLRHLPTWKLCQPSSKWEHITNQERIWQWEGKDEIRLSYAVLKIQWACNPIAHTVFRLYEIFTPFLPICKVGCKTLCYTGISNVHNWWKTLKSIKLVKSTFFNLWLSYRFAIHTECTCEKQGWLHISKKCPCLYHWFIGTLWRNDCLLGIYTGTYSNRLFDLDKPSKEASYAYRPLSATTVFFRYYNFSEDRNRYLSEQLTLFDW